MTFMNDGDSDEQRSDDNDDDSSDLIVGGHFGRFIGAPIRFFAKFGILGLPFIFAYWLFLTVAGSAIVIGAIWGGVVALFYVLFG